MGNTIEQNIKVKEIFDVSEALKGIKQIQDALGKLALDPNTKASFNKLFDNMERQAERASAAVASGFKNKSDVKTYTNAMDQIVDSYDRIINKIEVLKAEGAITLEVDTSEFKKINTEMDALKKNLSDFENKASKALSTIDKIEGRRGKNGTIKSVGSWNTAIEEFKNGNIQKATAALRVLKGLMTKASNNGVDFEKDKTWKSFKKDYDDLTKAINDYNAAEAARSKTESELNAKDQRRNEILQSTNKLLEDVEKATKESAQGAREYTRETEKAAKDTQQLNSQLDQFKTKAAYFFGISNAINLFKRAVRSAYDTVKDLDAVMTETAVVTDFDVGDMWAQLPEYTQRANELGVSIHSAYEAATIFYQQGLKTNEVIAVSTETLKMARIAGLDAATASDRMTNALRGFNMEMDKMSAQRVNDVYSKLAAITASDTDEISTAMTKVASLAHNANMEFETTAAFLAQIIESTRESAETAGTALKTVVARFSEVKKLYSKGDLLGQDEEGEEVDVNKVSTALRSAGINLNEYLTGTKGLDDIFMELAEKWDSLDQVQQRYIATMAAGSRQQSRFIALMSDYKRTVELVNAANNAEGASQEQYGKTLESLETKLARLKNAWDEFILGLANSDAIKGAVDLLTDLITAINNVIKTISGKNAGAKMITTFLTAFAGFKIGQRIFGATPLGSFFEGLTKTGSGQAEKGAFDIAKAFYTNLSDKIVGFKGKGGMDGVKQKFVDNISKTWGEVSDYFSAVRSDTKLNIWEQLSFEDTPEGNAAADKIWGMLQDGNTTVGELNQALTDAGQSFQITEDKAADFGIVMKDNNSTIGDTARGMKIASAACAALGAAMIGIGDAMENAGGDMQNVGIVVKALGAGLTAFGTIMSVYIPLQAQLMAKGVTGALMSIPFVGILAGITAILTALAVGFYEFNKYNSAEAKLERATEAAKQAAQAADDARDAYEKLGEAWDSLEDKYDTIENATKGTREWRDAIRETNEAVLELMDTYRNVEIKRDENGILHVVNQDQITDRERENLTAYEANERYSRIKQYENVKDVNYGELKIGLVGNELYKDAVDRLGDSLADYAYADNDEISKLLYEDYKRNGYSSVPLAEIEEFRQYAKDFRINEEGKKAQELALGSVIIDSAQLDKDLVKYASTLVDAEFIDKVVKANEDFYANAEEGAIKQAYAEAHDYSNFKEMEDDLPEIKDISVTMMRQFLVSQEIVKQGQEEIKTFVDNLDKLNPNETLLFSEQEGGALTRAQAEDLAAYSPERKKIVYNELGGDTVFGENGFDEYFSDWWDESVQAALNSFKPIDFGFGVARNLNEALTENLSSSTFKNYLSNLQSIYQTSGDAGMKEIQASISKMTENMKDPKEIEAFIKRINEVNWSSVESVKTLDSLAEEFDISQDEIKVFENQIIELNKAVSQFDAEKLISALGLASKIGSKEQGRSFTEEQYKTLLENGLSPDDFQLNIETGNYDYIGQDIQDVKNAILQQTDILRGELERTVASNEAIEKLQEKGSPEIGDPNSLRQFLNNYIGLAGDNALISRDAVGIANLSELQDMYNKVMQEYWNKEDTQAKLDQANAYTYQTHSGMGNASLALNGDEQAKKTLKQQLINSGVSEEEYQKLLYGIDNYDQATGKYEGTVASAGSVIDTFNKAQQYGIEAEDLNEYVEALKQVDDLQKANTATLYELALANARYQEGFKNVIESYDEWIQLRQEDGSIRAEDGNDIQQKAYTQLKKDLKEMLNLSEDVSDEFMQMPETAELLERAVNGDIEAVAELRANLAKIKISGQFNPADQDAIYNAIDDFTQESYTLEFGASWNDSALAQGLYDTLVAAGATVDQINQAFSNIGWTPPVETEVVQIKDVVQTNGTGYQEIVRPDGSIERVPVESLYTENQEGYITVPVVGENAHFVPPEMPSYTPSSSSGGGGGGGSTKKPTYWENPYDELYNLQEKINEALRTREALERRYQKLLKEEKATLKDIRQAYYSQIKNLGNEAELQKQMAAGRLRQINNIGSQMYTDEDGDRRSFSSMGVTKYASYNADTGLLQIDWEGLEAIANDSDREEEGKAAEAYISKLEELVSSYEEVRDKLWEIEDKIEDLRQAAIESYLSFEDRVMDAVVNKYQQEIDSYQAMSDAIEQANNEVLDSLREQIDLSRQIRDNTQKEEDIADMENRLAYLQRDTSGANALEIQKLQEDLEKARESYTDTLVDQAIEKMQNDADLAAEQRAKQIDIMQAQLDRAQETGELWSEVWDFMNAAAEGDGALSPYSSLVELLKDTEAFDSLSNIGKEKWWGEVAEQFHAAWVGKDEAEDKYNVDANGDGIIASSGTSSAIESVSESSSSVSTPSTSEYDTEGHDDATIAGVAMNICGPNNGWGDGDTRRERLAEKGFNPGEVQAIVNDIVNSGWDDSYYKRKYDIDSLSDYSYYAFKTGGLANFTGPAWLDGTKSKPELVLNAQDTANFIALKDILASLMSNFQNGNGSTVSESKQVNVNVEATISSDYDVDRLVDRVKHDIYQDGQYRNNTSIGYLR